MRVADNALYHWPCKFRIALINVYKLEVPIEARADKKLFCVSHDASSAKSKLNIPRLLSEKKNCLWSERFEAVKSYPFVCLRGMITDWTDCCISSSFSSLTNISLEVFFFNSLL